MPIAKRTTSGPIALCALAFAVVCAAPALAVPVGPGSGAGCQLNINPSSSTWSISGYDPFSSSPLSSTYQVIFSNSGTEACSFGVSIATNGQTYGLAGSAGQSLPYSLLDNTDNVNVTPFNGQTPPASQPHFQIAPGGQQIVNYSFIVDLSQLPTDGDFDQQLLVAAVSGGSTLVEKQVELTLNVTPSAVISLRGAYSTGARGGTYIYLGDLAPGPAITLLQLYVQSTGGYRVEADSANNGLLELRGSHQWTIPYSVDIGGHVLDLTSSAHFDAPRLTTARQDLLPMGFVIGDTSRKQAGRYEDTITLSVTAE